MKHIGELLCCVVGQIKWVVTLNLGGNIITICTVKLDGRTVWGFGQPNIQIFPLPGFKEDDAIATLHCRQENSLPYQPCMLQVTCHAALQAMHAGAASCSK